MSGFTPGPWRVNKGRGIHAKYPPSIGASPDGQPVIVAPEVWGASGDIREANAHLIAVAPEMYAFLKNVIPKSSIYEPEIEALLAKADPLKQARPDRETEIEAGRRWADFQSDTEAAHGDQVL